ncbi:hypothetical protein [Clostridium thermobutyricum]|uniref:hypothetical protein n=1 Tax=Clostridium thermobutyricum TaxID=29372 RepID=UPI003F52406B
MKLTKEILNKRICDVETAENPQTFLEFIRESEEQFGIKEANLNNISDSELNEYFEFLCYLWDK